MKMTVKQAQALNVEIENLVTAKGDNTELYSLEEKKLLMSYSGAGGKWRNGAKGIGTKYEFFTPPSVANAMWAIANNHVDKELIKREGGVKLLEPSAGVGALIWPAPTNTISVDAFELNTFSATILKVLLHIDGSLKVNITNDYFESQFYRKNQYIGFTPKYTHVIGNPPYGKFKGYFSGLGEDKRTKAPNWVDYFILRGLDLLHSGGILVMLVGGEQKYGATLFLDKENYPTKDMILERGELVEAYRMPTKIFDFSQCGTEIVAFKKK